MRQQPTGPSSLHPPLPTQPRPIRVSAWGIRRETEDRVRAAEERLKLNAASRAELTAKDSLRTPALNGAQEAVSKCVWPRQSFHAHAKARFIERTKWEAEREADHKVDSRSHARLLNCREARVDAEAAARRKASADYEATLKAEAARVAAKVVDRAAR